MGSDVWFNIVDVFKHKRLIW